MFPDFMSRRSVLNALTAALVAAGTQAANAQDENARVEILPLDATVVAGATPTSPLPLIVPSHSEAANDTAAVEIVALDGPAKKKADEKPSRKKKAAAAKKSSPTRAIDFARYAELYRSIPFNRIEFEANPSYRHDAVMELLTGKVRPRRPISRVEGTSRNVNVLISPYSFPIQWGFRRWSRYPGH